jgi:hypothetical protein
MQAATRKIDGPPLLELASVMLTKLRRHFRAFLVNIISNNLDHNLFLNYLYQELPTIYRI